MTGVATAPAWRVAITRSEEFDRIRVDLEAHGFAASALPLLIEAAPPDPAALVQAARDLERFDWLVCASVRSVRAIVEARGRPWPPHLRTAAVGPVTAAALVDAGARNPIHAETFNARALVEALRPLDSWGGRRVLVATTPGGRREIIDGLAAEGAAVTAVEAYAMIPLDAAAIRDAWQRADSDAVILGSASAARHLLAAVGADALEKLKAVVAIGPTTAAELSSAGVRAHQPPQATYAAAIAWLAAFRRDSVTA